MDSAALLFFLAFLSVLGMGLWLCMKLCETIARRKWNAFSDEQIRIIAQENILSGDPKSIREFFIQRDFSNYWVVTYLVYLFLIVAFFSLMGRGSFRAAVLNLLQRHGGWFLGP